MKKKNHKWRKGALPQLCVKCGVIRNRKTFKLLMAIVNHPPWDVYKYETKMVYSTGKGEVIKRPNCI